MIDQRDRQQLERLTFFSDAVFAIAMTLLVVEVRLPHLPEISNPALVQALLNLIPNYVGFAVSFLVLGRFWAAHHTIMGLLRAASPRLLWANLLLLMAVAFMPFPTAVVSEHANLTAAICFYSAWLLLIGLLNRRMIGLANNPALLASDVDPAILRAFRTRSLIPLLIAGGAFVAGLFTPYAGLAVLIAGSPLVSWLISRRADRIAPR